MKKIYFAMIVLGLSTGISLSASAEENSLKDRNCKKESDLAYRVMDFHQNGTPIYELLELTEDLDIRAMIINAYAAPQFESESSQDVVKSKFSKLQYLICLNR